MVVKTQTCTFSHLKIYPGHGYGCSIINSTRIKFNSNCTYAFCGTMLPCFYPVYIFFFRVRVPWIPGQHNIILIILFKSSRHVVRRHFQHCHASPPDCGGTFPSSL